MRRSACDIRLILVTILAVTTTAALAATTPSSGAITPANPSLTFIGGPFAVSNPADPLGNTPPACAADVTCGQFALTVSLPAADLNSYKARITVGWTSSGTTTQGSPTSDFDVYVFSPDLSGTQVATAASASNPEVASFDVSNGTYTIYVVPFDVSPSVAFNAGVDLLRNTPPPWPANIGNTSVPAGTPRFLNYPAPPGVAEAAGEPSIGINDVLVHVKKASICGTDIHILKEERDGVLKVAIRP